jgi:hypothetical protein
VLLNDPTFVEAARAFAERDIREAGPNETNRLRFAFRMATGREPDDKEITILDTLYRKQRAHYDSDRGAADKLLKVGESPLDPKLDRVDLAAMTLVTSTILNMDETITKN